MAISLESVAIEGNTFTDVQLGGTCLPGTSIHAILTSSGMSIVTAMRFWGGLGGLGCGRMVNFDKGRAMGYHSCSTVVEDDKTGNGGIFFFFFFSPPRVELRTRKETKRKLKKSDSNKLPNHLFFLYDGQRSIRCDSKVAT